jgi:hypothetical protein
MQSIYSRSHRNSIYQPATIHDIPFEVLRESFLHLLKKRGSDLVAASLACRAWRVVALDLMNSHKRFAADNGRIENFICGLHLRSIVGLERCTIKCLFLDLNSVGKEYIPLIAGVIAPTLSILWIGCSGIDSSVCYDTLDVFFEQCDGIRNLPLEDFDFGDDPASISQSLRNGMSRLRQFDLLDCRGDIRMFVENTPIPNLRMMYFESNRGAAEEGEIVSSFASRYRALTSVHITTKLESSASLLKVVESCRDLEKFHFVNLGGGLILERSDILAIASLSRLETLQIYRCGIADDAYSALTRGRGLVDLRLAYLVDPSVLTAIGRNIVSLDLWNPSKEVADGIAELSMTKGYAYSFSRRPDRPIHDWEDSFLPRSVETWQ